MDVKPHEPSPQAVPDHPRRPPRVPPHQRLRLRSLARRHGAGSALSGPACRAIRVVRGGRPGGARQRGSRQRMGVRHGFAIKTIDLGIVLAPVDATSRLTLIPHSLTLLIEFQAYALVMFGAYLLGRSWLRPATVDAPTRRQGYVRGLSRLGRLWLPALALFVIGAVYEAIEIYFLVPLVLGP